MTSDSSSGSISAALDVLCGIQPDALNPYRAKARKALENLQAFTTNLDAQDSVSCTGQLDPPKLEPGCHQDGSSLPSPPREDTCPITADRTGFPLTCRDDEIKIRPVEAWSPCTGLDDNHQCTVNVVKALIDDTDRLRGVLEESRLTSIKKSDFWLVEDLPLTAKCSVYRLLAQRSFALKYNHWHTQLFGTSRIKDLIGEPSKCRNHRGTITSFVKERFKNPVSASKTIQNGNRFLILEDALGVPGSSVVMCLNFSLFKSVHLEELICLAKFMRETESIWNLVVKTSKLLVQLQLLDGRTIPRSSSDIYRSIDETSQQSLKRRVEFSGSESNDRRCRQDLGSREALNGCSMFSQSLPVVGCRQDLYESNEHLSMPEKFALSLASVNVNIKNNIVDSRTSEEIVDPPAQVHEDCVTNNLNAHMSMPEESSWGMTIGKDPAPDVANIWNASPLIDLGPGGIYVPRPNPNHVDPWNVATSITTGTISMASSGPNHVNAWDSATSITTGTIGMASSGPNHVNAWDSATSITTGTIGMQSSDPGICWCFNSAP